MNTDLDLSVAAPLMTNPAHEHSDTHCDIPHSRIEQLFSTQVNKTPDSIALIFQQQKLSYQQLDQQSNQLARQIQQNFRQTSGREIKADDLIALYLDRSLEMIVAIMAIFKVGAAYVPIDPDYPRQRVGYMLKDSQSQLLLTQSDKIAELDEIITENGLLCGLTALDQGQHLSQSEAPLHCHGSVQDLAYIIYTSGTTGNPKGVMIEHLSLVNRLNWMHKNYPLGENDRVLQKTPYSFDVSVWELTWALLVGATIVIAEPGAHKDSAALVNIIERQKISVIHFVPSMFIAFLHSQNQIPKSLKHIFTSGEALSKSAVDLFYQLNHQSPDKGQAKLHNLYGPTETTIDSSYFNCAPDYPSVPIGKPIDNTRLYILDELLKPVACGVVGELYIAGVGVARGYLNRPELTQERFISNPFINNEDGDKSYSRLYKTGDLVRQSDDGNILYMGRNDFQVKIRGFRVELGEIENALDAHPQILQSVVIADGEPGKQRLVGYYQATAEISELQLHDWLLQTLPEYMVPSLLIWQESFALTVNGKLDRKALPDPATYSHIQYQAPVGENEQLLCRIIEKVLGQSQVGAEDDFFKIGGDSISAMQVCSLLRQQGLFCNAGDLSQYRTVRALALVIADSKDCNNAMDTQTTQLNSMQQLILHHQLSSNDVIYNEHITVDFADTQVVPEALNQALIRFVNHHWILRSRLDADYQHLVAAERLSESAKILEVQTIDSHQAFVNQLQQAINQSFDLLNGPLYRAILFTLDGQAYRLAYIVHHLVGDGDAMYNLFAPQLQALLENPATVLATPPQTLSVPPERENIADLTASMTALDLFGRLSCGTPSEDTVGQFLVHTFEPTQTAQLLALAKSSQTSPYAILLSSLYLTLAKFANTKQLTVGGVKSLRSCVTEPVYGNYLANEIFTHELNLQHSGLALISEVFNAIQATMDTLLPYDKVLQAVRQNGAGEQQLPNVFMTLEPRANHQTDWVISQNEVLPQHVKYDLYFEFDLQQSLSLRIEYRTSHYQHHQIEQLRDGFTRVFSALLQQPTQPIDTISVLSEQQYQQLVVDFNAKQTPFPEQGLVALFSQQVAERADETALIFADQRISYRELDERSNQLAHQISRQYQQATGAALQPDSLIAMYMERSPEMIIAMLAILKAGGAYVPILTSYPEQRVNFILADTAVALVLADPQAEMADKVAAKIMVVDSAHYGDESTAALDNTGDINDLAYVIYTSGTTGQPKGVMVEQRSVVSLVKDNNYLKLGPNDAMMQLASAAFDAATFEIWGALLNGARLYLPSDDKALVSNSDAFKQTLVNEGISILWLTKTLFETLYLADKSLFGSLNSLLVGGEALDAKTMSELKRHPQRPKQIINGYGPTESTTFTTTFDCDLAFDKNVPIGKPINGRQVYILDDSLNPVPQGVMGELYIGGAGLARGYLNQPALTAQRFIESPFIAGQKLYRSGDLVRLRNDGQIEYHGRNDNQVKIRGFRIELGEIEQVLGQYPGIVQGVVTVFEHQANKRLVGYFRAANGAVDMAQLQQHLAQNLPEYMVPSLLIPVEQFALTSNGKLDTQALPQPSFISADSYVAPANELEQRLCAIVEAVLSLPQVGVADDFFRIGGDSILSIQLSSRLKKAGFDVAVKDVFRCKTVRRLAAFAESNEGKVAFQAEQGQLEGSFDLLPIQQWFFAQLDNGLLPAYNHWNQSFMLAVPALDYDKLNIALKKLAQHHDILRCRFNKLDGSYQQSYQLDADLPALKQLDASHQSLEQIGNTLTQWQAEFELFSHDAKPLWSVGYVENVGEPGANYLFFAAHHLIIDAVSWRILAEDLRALYQGESLLPKTASYRAWVNAVQAYGRDNAEQQRYWQGLLNQPSAYPAALATVQHQQIEFSSQLTQDLLKLANRAYNTDINDLLLSALAAALQGLSGQGENLITLEGHGREAIDPTLETARTVGWFTTMYPVKLEHHQDCATAIKTVKESLRQVPDKGIGFGVLNTQAMTQLPPICFNYLGVLDGADAQSQQAQWQLSDMTSGEAVDSRNIDDSLLSLNGMVIEGRLQFMLDGRLSNDAMAQFGERFKARLTELTEHCVAELAQGRTHHTPADFELDISVELFDQLFTDEIEGIYPANSLQQGFIYHALSQADDDAYRVQMLIDYPDAIDVALFEQAWRLAVASYPILRTSFNWTEKPIQLIHKTGELDLRCHDCTDAPDKVAAVKAIQQADRAVGFDLSQPRLLRLHLIKLSDSQYALLKSDHHSITDGWSLPILLDKVHCYYAALINQAPINVVVDGAYEEAQRYYQSHKKESKTFWQGQLQQMQAANDLNPMFSRPIDLDKARTVRDPQHYDVILATAPLKQLASNQGVTLNTLVQFAWHKLITIYTGDSQSIVGTTVSGRAVPVANIEQSVGLYINTLPLIVNWDNDNTVAAQLEQINQSIAEINSYAFEPLSAVQKDGRAFHSLLVYENYPTVTSTQDRPLHPHCHNTVEKVDYPLALIIEEMGEQLTIRLNYEGANLNPADAARLAGHLQLILQQLPERLEQHHGNINIVTPEEYQALVVDYNQNHFECPKQTIIQRFEQQVANRPNSTALVNEQQTLTYQQLDQQATRLAGYIQEQYQQHHGRELAANSRIAIGMDRSIELIVTILAVLKTGCSYVPVEPEYPVQRIVFLLNDAQVDVVLTQPSRTVQLQQILIQNDVSGLLLTVDKQTLATTTMALKVPQTNIDDPACLIYTSGTTGNPKGVVIGQQAVLSLVTLKDVVHITPNDALIMLAPPVFDASLFEMWGALLNGAKLYVPTDHKGLLANTAQFKQLLLQQQISIALFTKTLFDTLYLSDNTLFASLNYLIFGGEAADLNIVNQLLSDQQNRPKHIINGYGPTESTTFSSLYACVETMEKSVPIGKPSFARTAYVLDRYLNLVPQGVIGELYIGGAGLALGYLNRPDIEKERFIDNPFATEHDKANGFNRLYKSGDLVRLLPDGNLEYLGRNDFQIKIRGFRVELPEIENTINQYPSMLQSAVLVYQHLGQKRLVGYYRSANPVSSDVLQTWLSEKLPDYMVPALLLPVTEFKHNVNGKLDRTALPEPVFTDASNYVAPSNEVEAQLCTTVAELLKLEKVGIEDNFFKIGGDSISQIALMHRINQAFGLDIGFEVLLRHPRIQSLAEQIALQQQPSDFFETGEL